MRPLRCSGCGRSLGVVHRGALRPLAEVAVVVDQWEGRTKLHCPDGRCRQETWYRGKRIVLGATPDAGPAPALVGVR